VSADTVVTAENLVTARRRAAWRLTGQATALGLLLLVAPLMLIIAAAIAAESGVPILFAHERIGLNGHRFAMLKFRKFPRTVGRNTLPLTMANDRRCTRIGALLTKTKLDELPQLWNVVRGDMALVGPRPEATDFEDCYIGPFRQILQHRPGIFGPSQAAFRAEAALFPPDQDPLIYYRELLFPAKAALDLAYYPSRTLAGDIRWVLRGLLAILGPARAAPIGPPRCVTERGLGDAMGGRSP
jgi:lipopolysaccharide/colanic/teichoic acid biosynthesis glycosyltransferase